mmetsp:Transcript_24390/g.56212  ORF Transcript_24390/g.56212 Transcript_24390/m.56212 type:complete len:484 (-) Transcript_24390:47-1498(-)
MPPAQSVQSAESELWELSQRADEVSARVSRARATLLARDATLASTQKARAKAAARKSSLADAQKTLEGDIAKCEQKCNAWRTGLEGCWKNLLNERASLDVAQQVQEGIIQARTALSKVRQELVALSSEKAKQVALQLPGEDLPEEVAPAVQLPASVSLDSTLPAAAFEALAPKEQTLLQQAQESRAVLAALLRSLSTHSVELREGLKQWSFARHMNNHTQEAILSLADKEMISTRATAELLDEHNTIDKEGKALLARRDAVRKELSELQTRHEAAQQKGNDVDGKNSSLQDSYIRHKTSMEEARRAHERLMLEGGEAESELGARSSELEAFPAEAAKKVAAASKLVDNMQAQAQKVEDELVVVRGEFASLQQAHSTLQQAYAAVQVELDETRQVYQSLRDTHDMLNRELSALAKHYTEALAVLVPSGSLGVDVPVSLAGSQHDPSASPGGRSPPAALRSPLLGRYPTHTLTPEGRLVTTAAGL